MAFRGKTRLAGARVLITGGARGIGAATAAAFARRGAQVWIGDVDADAGEKTAAALGIDSVMLDVTDLGSWQTALAGIEGGLGGRDDSAPLDICVNNAGVMPLGALADETENIRDLILDVNVRGMLNGMQAVLPGMAARGHGQVINVASMAGMLPIPGMVTYNASKFAALGASLAARREYAGTGVAVSAILPAAVRTELASGAPLGAGLPTVEAADVAEAIIAITTTHAARRSVPRWVAPAVEALAMVPEPLESLARRIVGDRRALTGLDHEARRAYTERINRQARAHRDHRGAGNGG